MQNLFKIMDSIQAGDYSAVEITPKEKSRACREMINNVVDSLRSESRTYPSEYNINKQTISGAFSCTLSPSSSRLSIIINRLTLIDSMYSTQMRMRPYGIGELAEAISLFGDDTEFKTLCNGFLFDHNVSRFDYSQALMRFYNNGTKGNHSNLLSSGFGTEKNKKSSKRALSLISKYFSFLTSGNFPIYDSIVKEMIPRVWNICMPGSVLSKTGNGFVDYLSIIETLRSNLGEISYDELDFVLWHIGKIIHNNFSLIMTMEDYLSIPRGYSINSFSLSGLTFLNKNKTLKALFELAQFVLACEK